MSVFHSNCRIYMKGLMVLKMDLWCCQVKFCFVFQVCELVQFHTPWLMSNYILLQILKSWAFVEKNRNCEVKIIKYFYWCQNISFDRCQNLSSLLWPYYLRPYINIPVRFMSSLRCKMEIEFRKKTKKTRHNKGMHFKTQP